MRGTLQDEVRFGEEFAYVGERELTIIRFGS
jgi:hypothetical protein